MHDGNDEAPRAPSCELEDEVNPAQEVEGNDGAFEETSHDDGTHNNHNSDVDKFDDTDIDADDEGDEVVRTQEPNDRTSPLVQTFQSARVEQIAKLKRDDDEPTVNHGTSSKSTPTTVNAGPKRVEITTPTNMDPEERAAEWFGKLCDTIKIAAKKALLPKKFGYLTQKTVSEHTKGLFEKKRALQSKSKHLH